MVRLLAALGILLATAVVGCAAKERPETVPPEKVGFPSELFRRRIAPQDPEYGRRTRVAPAPIGVARPTVNELVARANLRRGEAVYRAYCRGCHGDRARGDGPDAASLAVAPRDLVAVDPARLDPERVYAVVADGGEPHGLHPSMPAFAGRLAAQHIADVAVFLRRRTEKRPPRDTASMKPATRLR